MKGRTREKHEKKTFIDITGQIKEENGHLRSNEKEEDEARKSKDKASLGLIEDGSS